MDTFPHFPAVVITDESRIPADVKKKQPDSDAFVAVEFFGKPKSWGWVQLHKLAPLLAGEDDKYLSLAAKKSKSKQVKDAYDEAKAA